MLRSVLLRGVAAASSRKAAAAMTVMRPSSMRSFSSDNSDDNDSKKSTTSRFLKLADQIEVSDQLAPGEEEVELPNGYEEEFFIDLNPGGVGLDEQDNIRIFDQYMSNPLVFTIHKLATDNRVSVERIEATIVFQGIERGLSIAELREKVFNIKEAKQAEIAEGIKNPVASLKGSKGKKGSEGSSNYINTTRSFHDEDEEVSLLSNEEYEEANKPDRLREPNFLFLRDDMMDELPPLHRQFRKQKGTDQLTVAEAIALQRGAENNKVTLLPSFAKGLNPTGKWKIAIKDISTKKAPLYMRDVDGSYRLASDDEVAKRTWVKRPPFFQGIERYV
ncbi:hypothetical protein H257_12016 [Aphanomyces astaci]|uniref:Uncharacterized protein n=2 Tax=Aphanomyces astaci TaxID=112090 RepID=W4G2P9_APHAT|nr:hypothetical protein H257_12016 [Aphanomyces astaci]ETV73213.1 hypothetical protein H257_12016 [Aphanomyces astaci]RQM31240.1 hypothetical protein B5M09_012012 [Aphanomyces astaci]|eukprot:XP_009837418.1 hypothetical protein H257_12016 [Aphanomyces astaci]